MKPKIQGWHLETRVTNESGRMEIQGRHLETRVTNESGRMGIQGRHLETRITNKSRSLLLCVHFFLLGVGRPFLSAGRGGEGRGGKGRPSVGMEGVREVLGMHRRGQEELIIAHVVARFKPAAALNVTCLKCMVNEVKWRGAFSPHHTTRGDTGLVEFEIITK